MRYASAILFPMSLFSAACAASWFVNGGKLVDKSYAPTVKSSYMVTTCMMSGGAEVNGPAGVVFQLVQEGAEVGIFERAADGSGAVITNRWSDEKADHYFGWVQSQGWEYVIPKDPAVEPTRLVYVGLQTEDMGPFTKPTSPASATCPMETVPAFAQLAVFYEKKPSAGLMAELCKTTLPSVKSENERYRVLDYCMRHSGASTVESGLGWASAEDTAFYKARRPLAEYRKEVAARRFFELRTCKVTKDEGVFREGTCVRSTHCDSTTSRIPRCCLVETSEIPPVLTYGLPGGLAFSTGGGDSVGHGHCRSQLSMAEQGCTAGDAAMCRLGACCG
jgi:hypothetical protein